MLNIALTFTEEDNKKLYKVANSLHKAVPSVYILGENSVPHISIAHINAEECDAEAMWKILINKGIEHEYNVILKSFYIDAPWNERIYTGFSMEEFGKLVKLQTEILATLPNKEVYSGLGSDFYPHITTSCHLNAENLRIPPFMPPFKRIRAYLTIGTRDSYGRMEEILFRQKIKG